MSYDYDTYLLEHRNNVIKSFDWMLRNFEDGFFDEDTVSKVIMNVTHFHDQSKFDKAEYDAYDRYFFGEKRMGEIMSDFDYAWLHHIQNNPHHWQHWVLFDDLDDGLKALDMPYEYVVEMICDWWSFSWKADNLYEIFDWYKSHQDTMLLSQKTRQDVWTILKELKKKLDEQNGQ